MITQIKAPTPIHSANVANWWHFSSNFRFAPKFNLRVNIVSGTTLLNSVLLPTNPDNISPLNTGRILPDFIDTDPKPFISGASASGQSINYKLELSESFEGLYIQGTSSAGRVEFVDVLNNFSVLDIGTPSKVRDIGFIGGPVSEPIENIWIFTYATGSNGFVNRVQLSTSPTQSTSGITASVGAGSFGFLQMEEITTYSIGASFSTATASAVLADIDYFPWNEGNDFGPYLLGDETRQFLTRKKTFTIGTDEWATLSFINSAAGFTPIVNIIDDLNNIYSFTMSIATASAVRVDIGAGTANLGISPTASRYTITLGGVAPLLETITFNIDRNFNRRNCGLSGDLLISNLRLTWLNDLGGWDYYTFKWLADKTRQVVRDTFNKNLRYTSTKTSRQFTSWKIEDWVEWNLVSDLIDDDTAEWLSALFTSRAVYMIYDTNIYPVEVLTSSYISNRGFTQNEANVNIRFSRSNIK